METNNIIEQPKSSINNSAKPVIQIQNFFRVDHNSKNHQIKSNTKNNNGTHQYEIYYSSRSKSKERELETSYVNKPKIILNNLPPEFNINTNNNKNYLNNINEEKVVITNNNINKNYYNNNNNKEKVINNFLLGTKTETKIRALSNNKTSSLTNIHINNNKLSCTTNELSQNINNNKNIVNKIDKKNNLNHFKTEGSEFETTKENTNANINTNTKNVGFTNNFTSTGFKPINICNIKNAGKTVLKYDKNDYNNTNLSEIEEILTKKKDKIQKRKTNNKQKGNKGNLINISGIDKKMKNVNKNGNGIKPIKINNYNNNYQRKVIPPIMNKNDKIIFDGESMFSKKTQISNLNNINYSKIQKNTSNSNLNLLEQPGKTFTNFKNDIKFNFEGERKSLPVKSINNNLSKKKDNSKNISRPSSEDNNKNNYESININNNDKEKIKKIINELITIRKIPNNLNEGILYKISNGYKYYFDLTNINCYLLKEISDTSINLIEEWKKNYRKCSNYLKIIGYKKYDSQPYYTVVLEHPTGGENFNDIINLIGFYDVKLLLNISQIIYECLSVIKNDINNMNIIFCLCDIFLNINNHIKIIPPFIRNIHINTSINKDICQCKKSINKIIKIFNYDKNSISLICLGVSLIQLITQNLLFKMNSYNYIMNNDNLNNIIKYKKCCLIHTILEIESNLFNNKSDLLLSHFIKLYPECVSDFIHICTLFNYDNNYNLIYKHDFLNMYDASNNIEIYIKELFNIINFDSNYNHYVISYEKFLEKFESLYKKLEINPYVFNKVLRTKKISNNFSRIFNLNKNNENEKFLEIIMNKHNNNVSN